MKRIVIFSGTTEGRTLSSLLSEAKIHHIVCVATDYGAGIMTRDKYADIHSGRMDFEEMTGFLKDLEGDSDSIVIDATHPFATEVTSIIKSVAYLLNIRYLRISRDTKENLPADTALYRDITECAHAVDTSSGNILLTTGSKELSGYCGVVSGKTKKRTFVRVLPTLESLRLCADQGIDSDHIIAMQGPFDRELNEAIIRQYNIRHLVTKESGTAGGFTEKMEAAICTGARLHVLKRPSDDVGISVEEAFRLVTGKDAPKLLKKLQISVAGIGMGAPSLMTCALKEELSECDAVFGAERILKNLACSRKYKMYRAEDIIPVLENERFERVVIAFSGDTGFYSGARSMIDALKKWRSDIDVQILPGVSSFSYLASRLGESYDDALLFSLHGRSSEKDINLMVEKLRYNRKIFILLSGAEQIREIAKRIARCGIEAKLFTGVSLSYESEAVRELTVQDALAFDAKGPVTALVINPNPQRRRVIGIRRDSDFIREKVPMTKECIRHESIIRLGLREGDVLYDIGGGTGSVAIEAALLDHTLDVCSFERNSEAALLIRKNAEKLGAFNVTVIEGEAQDTIKELKGPDCVFIGGSGGSLRQIIDILHKKRNGIRFVINAVSLETMEEVRRIMDEYGPTDEEAVMITVSEVRRAGSHHMLQGQNPVWIFSFTI